MGGEEDIDRAVASSRRCYESDEWQSLTATERGELLDALADEIEANIDRLSRAETLANGKLLSAMRSQVESLPGWYRYYAGLADKVTGDTIQSDKERMFTFTLTEPYGVVGVITPWNSPLMLATYKLAPAFAAGNTAVLKPSEITPVSAIMLAELALDAGFPPGALNVVTGYGDAGAALSTHDNIDKVAFTGGTDTGSKVGAAAGKNIIPATLELGGKSANIVFPDADLDNAVVGAVKGIFAATGQTCIAGSRLFLHESIHDEFVDRLVERAESLALGDPRDENTEMGPVAFDGQFEKVQKYVDIGKEEATLVTGGEQRTDLSGELFYAPTIFTGVENDMRIAQEEIFGPVLSVLTYEDEEEVIELANDTEYGLAAGVWTENVRRAIRVSSKLEAGVVWVNAYRESSFTTPSGGYKKSGIGIEKGKDAIEQYIQRKSVWIETEGIVSDPFKLI
ncbi:aldehyde dehydrogenase [Salinigranum rubrum]|uniref:aldehyde dehydrogenase n=1 Tax=Salinigranum rubrum TaxID=755307 RepID=UPI001FEA148D|nr:aldehyde dehydrogenase [Salinigranum rubrum]